MYTVTHGNIFVYGELKVYVNAQAAAVNHNTSDILDNLSLKVIHLTAQHTLSALFHMLVYISVWEFICCQSPHSMKGLIFGVLYAIQGLFRSMAVALFTLFHHFWNIPSFDCAISFLLVNIAIGVVAFLVYVCVSKRYKYRMRDEPSHVRRYAEEYYSKIPSCVH